MSDNEEVLCRFGTQLETLEEDEIPAKKPIAIEDQIVTDSNGKRRFHGAFTGGFSAGFWNTVGSLEGWKPQQFKSSRMEKAEKKAQKPTDFMDEEDLGEFGIAPQRIQTTEDFAVQTSKTTENLRKRQFTQSLGPIPGIPVLQQLLQPAKENVAIRLLKKMGWKVGQGIGARQKRKEKKAASRKIASEQCFLKKYGCEMGPLESVRMQSEDDSSESELSDDEITYAPDDYEQLFCGIKDNVFGLGYIGLNKNVLQNNTQSIDLFRPFEVMSKNNKKLSIRGQAFGVGALEEEDEDIYANDDMTKYDFSLNDRQKLPKKKNIRDEGVLEGFHARQNENLNKKVFIVDLPNNFKPRNWGVRKSRFEPLDDDKAAVLKQQSEHKRMGLGRHDLKPHERRNILENFDKKSSRDDNETEENIKKNYWEKVNQKYKAREAKTASVLSSLETNKSNFTRGGLLTIDDMHQDEKTKEEDKLKEQSVSTGEPSDKTSTIFKPFLLDERKQTRYEKYLEADLKTDEEITKFLKSIQPLEMSSWDKEMEKKEFIQACKIYKPLKGLMSVRFISEGSGQVNQVNTTKEKPVEPKKIEIYRTKVTWHPCSLLCKRFNVAEVFLETKIETNAKKRSRFSVFDYIEAPINTKKDFVTPVIIPSKVVKTQEIISQTENNPTENQRISTKELFIQEMQNSDPSNIKKISNSELSPTVEFIKKNSNQSILSTSGNSVGVDELRKTSTKRSTYKKTELEKKVEALKNEHPSEKKDLFKAIFESDDDETSNEDEESVSYTENHAHGNDKYKKAGDSEMNILRNTSPPRGIFAYLFSENNESKNKTDANESTSKKKATKEDELPVNRIVEESKSEYYGPAIPTVGTSIDHSTTSPEKDLDGKLVKLLTKSKKSAQLLEEWIEKGETKKGKKKKKEKKKKSKKHKRKEHKKSSGE